MKAELYIGNGGEGHYYCPALEEGITWSLQRRGAPGKLGFKVIPDEALQVSEGSTVVLRADGKPVFVGYLFKQQRDKDGIISMTAYDQIRYLKNKDTIVYENKTASQLLAMLAADYQLMTGEIEDTGYVIPSCVEENKSLLDMMENALGLTLDNTGEHYILYDDAGKLTLKSLSHMIVGEPGAYLMLDEQTGENYDYTSSIDDNTYNRIKLVQQDGRGGERHFYSSQDIGNIKQWGTLQYFDTVSEGENGQAKADALLTLYNHKTRNLKLSNAIGDIRVRGGSLIIVRLNLADLSLCNFMLVEEVSHTFKEGEHWMDLTLCGGEFNA